MAIPTRLSSSDAYESLISQFDTWLFDCDGVLWHGDRLEPGAVDVLAGLRARGKKLIFVTNNASQSRKSYSKKFEKLGVEVHHDEIFGSAYAGAVYLSTVYNLPKDKEVYVIGMRGLEEELEEEGIKYSGGTDPSDCTPPPNSSLTSLIPPNSRVGAVLCGLDLAVSYTKFARAYYYLTHNEGCAFVATNDDSTYPAGESVVQGGSEGGVLLPGSGAISCGPIATALGRPPIVVGKPEKVLWDVIHKKHNIDTSRAIMVGDRFNTDILFGKRGGVKTLLVLSGVATEQDLANPPNSDEGPIIPDYVTKSIGDLKEYVG